MAKVGNRTTGGTHVDRHMMQDATNAVFGGLMWTPAKEDAMDVLSRPDMPHKKSERFADRGRKKK